MVPTLVNGEIKRTWIQFEEPDEIGLDACDCDVRTERLYGVTDWVGATAAQLGGEFKGWVSDDQAAIPVRAEVETDFGPIVVELEAWSGRDWVPPSWDLAVQ